MIAAFMTIFIVAFFIIGGVKNHPKVPVVFVLQCRNIVPPPITGDDIYYKDGHIHVVRNRQVVGIFPEDCGINTKLIPAPSAP